MPEQSNDLVTSLVDGEPEIVDETEGLEVEVEEDASGQTEEGAQETETQTETQDTAQGQEQAQAEGETDEKIDWKARAEKEERIRRQFQSQHDQMVRQLQPYANRLAEIMKADQEKAEKMQKDRDLLLREFATDPAGVINTLVGAQLQSVRSNEQAAQLQVEAQSAFNELVEYASAKGVDGNALTLLLAPYNNFVGMHPQQALPLAKVLVDQAAAPKINQQTQQAMLQAADQHTKQKLVKKTPAGQAGGSVQGREKTQDDQFWERINAAGNRNPLRRLK